MQISDRTLQPKDGRRCLLRRITLPRGLWTIFGLACLVLSSNLISGCSQGHDLLVINRLTFGVHVNFPDGRKELCFVPPGAIALVKVGAPPIKPRGIEYLIVSEDGKRTWTRLLTQAEYAANLVDDRAVVMTLGPLPESPAQLLLQP